jgi:hypothetical protein
MPSRKQRRRRAKERRHEYEYVYVDGEGREVEVDEAELERDSTSAKPKTAAARANGRGSAAPARSSGRKVDPPSWTRALKRSLIFAPFMFVTLYFLDQSASVAVRVLVTLQMLVFFVPFTYLVDRMMFRRFGRRGAGAPAAARGGRRAAKS